ncbi:MAG: type II toxin-antitoxin system Phd/YefM family antitoxin [Pseudomonadota bacterium]
MGLPKTKSATVFREDLYETLKEVAKGTPYLVTQRGGDNIVLLSQTVYNKMLEEQDILRSIAAGVADIEAGRMVAHRAAVARFRKLQQKWK